MSVGGREEPVPQEKLHKYDVWVDIHGSYQYQNLGAYNYEDAVALASDMARGDAGRGYLLDIEVVDVERLADVLDDGTVVEQQD